MTFSETSLELVDGAFLDPPRGGLGEMNKNTSLDEK